MVGQTISHYTIIDKLGKRGMGVVYTGEDTKLRRVVSLKFLAQHLLVTEADWRCFVREVRSSAALSHANIATVFEIDEAEARTFIALEYVEGQNLAAKILHGGIMVSPHRPLDEFARALEAALEGGESGSALFHATALGADHLDTFRRVTHPG